ncbi:neutral/alkaline non-lysosomal ceramidase N-terminal domain-containing protein [Limnoglobus roseus]|uniref:Neutral/alkaline non-lysosomal ceramidase N-terminal domain-containing protein n=1 Tax=Limnoglobus roseus TaxID=2598579 RepID=A0A5C1AGC8_9BACT|nr:neutral/alkaline non-lysosomal ceramidase N-terminal domain-containing protein [Limnoglobus roseus]QEL17880.1 hypothetical protein PX52LOC_04892 [Limnoglobus roseus]
MTRLFSLVLLAGMAFPLFAADAQLSVGFAEVDLSPTIGKKPVYLAGFGLNRKATKVHDPIMARAVVFSDGKQKIGFVCVDVIGLFLPTVENVRKQLPGFQYVLVSSTHNHEGPDTLGLWGATYLSSGVDPAYLKSVEDGAAKAILQAGEKLVPVRAEIGTAKNGDLLHDNRQPIVLHDEVVVLRFTSPETKKVAGMIVQWNCHPETLDDKNTEVSADFVASTVKTLEKEHQCPVVYFNGSVGGLMTSLKVEVKNAAGVLLQDGTFEKTEKYGELVAGLANQAMKSAGPVNLLPFDVRTRTMLMPVDNSLYKIGKQVGTLNRAMYEWKGQPVPEAFVETKDVMAAVAVKTEVGRIRLGELDIAAIPGEIYPELVLGKVQDPVDPGADFPDAPVEPAIYAQLKNKHRMLIGLANDELGYFIPKRQWDEKAPYCYGLKKAPYGEINSIGPEAAPLLCQAFKELAEKK